MLLKQTRKIGTLLLLALSLGAGSCLADDTAPIPRDDPQQMLQTATDRMLALAKSATEYADKDPDRYYREVRQVLDPIVDMPYFARGVMATYASSRLYRTLKTEEEKTAFRERIKRFADTMETVLIEKYADALLTFEGERIDIKAPTPIAAGDKKATLIQTIYDKNNQTYTVQYSLHKNDDGWLVYNIIVEGVNMGGIYRTQFADEVERHGNDADYVVDHWGELMANRPDPIKSKKDNP